MQNVYSKNKRAMIQMNAILVQELSTFSLVFTRWAIRAIIGEASAIPGDCILNVLLSLFTLILVHLDSCVWYALDALRADAKNTAPDFFDLFFDAQFS